MGWDGTETGVPHHCITHPYQCSAFYTCRGKEKICHEEKVLQCLPPSFWVVGVFSSQNHRNVEVGKHLSKSSSSRPLLKQGHLKKVAQDYVQLDFE